MRRQDLAAANRDLMVERGFVRGRPTQRFGNPLPRLRSEPDSTALSQNEEFPDTDR